MPDGDSQDNAVWDICHKPNWRRTRRWSALRRPSRIDKPGWDQNEEAMPSVSPLYDRLHLLPGAGVCSHSYRGPSPIRWRTM